MGTKYETHCLPMRMRASAMQTEIQALLDEKSKDGWKLFQIEACDDVGYVVVVLEKDDTIL